MNLEILNIDRPKLIKMVLILVVAIALYFAIRKVIKTIKADQNSKNLDLEIKTDILSYSNNEYKAMADTLDSAMDDLGTDDSAVTNVFKRMKNTSDVLQLIKTFGVRDYHDSALSYVFTNPYTLPQWIHADLSDSEIADINAIFTKNSINFFF